MGLGFLGRKRKTDHERARELLSEYLDQRLTPDGTEWVELHLRECERCSDELRALQTTRQMLHSLPRARLPRSFILEAAPRPAPMPRSFFWLRTATATAAAAFVALLAVSAVLPMAGAPASMPAALQPMQAPARTAANDQAVASQAKPAAAPARSGDPVTAAAERASAPAPLAAPAAAPRPMATVAPAAPAAAAPAAAPAAPAAASGARAATSEPAASAAGGASAPPPASADAAIATGQPERAKAAAAPGAAGAPEAATTMAQEPQKREAGTDSFGAAQPEPTAPASTALWAEEPRPAQGPSGLALLQATAAGLALLLGVATAGVWWGHRRRNL